MAVTFADGSSDTVTITAATSINDLTAFTILLWVYPTAITANRIFWSKRPSGAFAKQFRIGSTAGFLELGEIARATANALANTTALIVANSWQFVGGMYNEAGGSAATTIKLFYGTEAAIVAEPTYATQTQGSGATTADAASSMMFGNRNGLTVGFPGHIAWGGLWNRALTLSEVQDQQYYPKVTNGCVTFIAFDDRGTAVDQSGSANNGTITGATVNSTKPSNVILPLALYGRAAAHRGIGRHK